MPEAALINVSSGVEVIVGRQPIFDLGRQVIGFELLFRPLLSASGELEIPSGELMTAEVLMSSLNLGVDNIVGNKLAFINADRGILTGDTVPLMPPERCVLEILETVAPDDEVIARCEQLVARGYSLALDDFVWFEGAERLLELASIVKLDVLALCREELVETMERCARFDVKLLAEKVETPQQLLECLALGFDYFQGYVLSRPEIVSGRGLSPTKVARLQLLTKIFDDEIDIDGVESIVMTDPALVHQLLELAGIGATHGMKREVRTVREAGVLAGTRRLRSWAALLMLVERNGGCDEKIITALVRSQMCELLAFPEGPEFAAFVFTAAMVSCFDVLLGVELEEVLRTLSVSDELRDAALCGPSRAGDILADTIDYQFGVLPVGGRSGFDDASMHAVWVKALSWAQRVSSAVAVDA